jgi:ribosomal protein S18 acetylase RimI-like enzyme
MPEIRKLTEADAEAFRALRLEGLRRHPLAFGSSYEEEAARSLEEWKARLGRDAREAFVAGAWQGERLAGTAGFYRITQRKARHKSHIWGVYVDPEFRGMGVAGQLIRYVLQEAAMLEGLTRVLLTVQADNASAVKLYESCGFAAYGGEPKAMFFDGQYVDDLFMAYDFEAR